MKKTNIAIIGLGNIGSFLFKYLNKNEPMLPKPIMAILIFFIINLIVL